MKWAITILVAGFIAQFGKKFATFLIDKTRRFRMRKATTATVPPPAAGQPLPAQAPDAQTRSMAQLEARKAELKLNKKMAKALAKERKKK